MEELENPLQARIRSVDFILEAMDGDVMIGYLFLGNHSYFWGKHRQMAVGKPGAQLGGDMVTQGRGPP